MVCTLTKKLERTNTCGSKHLEYPLHTLTNVHFNSWKEDPKNGTPPPASATSLSILATYIEQDIISRQIKLHIKHKIILFPRQPIFYHMEEQCQEKINCVIARRVTAVGLFPLNF